MKSFYSIFYKLIFLLFIHIGTCIANSVVIKLNPTDSIIIDFDKNNSNIDTISNIKFEVLDTAQIDNIIKCGYTYTRNNLTNEKNREKGIVLLTKTLDFSRKVNYQRGILYSLFLLNEVSFFDKNYSIALKYAEELLKEYTKLGDKEGIASSWLQMISILIEQNDYVHANEQITLAIPVMMETGRVQSIKYLMEKLSLLYANKNRELLNSEKIKYETKQNFLITGLSILSIFLIIVFIQRSRILKEKKRSEELLLNILPSETAEELKQNGSAKPKSFNEVTVMFTDFKNFTKASESLSPEDLVNEINLCYSEFDKIIARNKIEKIKTIGDSYMAAGGLPVENKSNPFDTVNAAIEIQNFMLQLKEQRILEKKTCFEIRIGIHTGPVIAGIVGIKKFSYDIWGDTVNIASRMETKGEVGKVNISNATYELIKGKY